MTPPPRLPASRGANYYRVDSSISRANVRNAWHLGCSLYCGKLRGFQHKLSICRSACDDKVRVSAWFDCMSSDAAEVNNKFLSLRNPEASITEVSPLSVTQGGICRRGKAMRRGC